MKALETAGPNPEIGTVQRYSHAFVRNRYFMGTSSLETKEKESCVEAASPIKVVAPINAGIDWAVAATILPTSARAEPQMKNHRRLSSMSGLDILTKSGARTQTNHLTSQPTTNQQRA